MYTETEERTPLENGALVPGPGKIYFERTCNIVNAGAQAMLEQAGFALIERHLLEHDPVNVWFVSKKERPHVS